MNKHKVMANRFFIAVLCLICILLTACQPTPEEGIVANKDDLTDEIQQSSAPIEDKAESDSEINPGGIWKETINYDSGNRLTIDAKIPEEVPASVISVSNYPFEGGEDIKVISQSVCPDEEIYALTGVTTEMIQNEINYYKKLLFRLESGLPLHPEDGPDEEPIPADEYEYYHEMFTEFIKSDEARLETAVSELEPTDYKLIDAGDNMSYQANMVTERSGDSVKLNFSNYDIASHFSLESYSYQDDNLILEYELLEPETLAGEAEYDKALTLADKVVEDMQIDYMGLDSVVKGEKGYLFYYVRQHNGLNETHISNYIGLRDDAVDGAVVMELWGSELLAIEVQEGQVKKIDWRNRAKVDGIDNENVEMLSFDEIKDIFYKQIGYILTPETEYVGKDYSDVTINRIEFGYTKILMKNTYDDYKLIPTWSFIGRSEKQVEAGVSGAKSICFLTINALDGSVIDHQMMY